MDITHPDEIRARINEIDSELFAESNFQCDHILSADADSLNREREKRFAALGRERSELAAKLPPTGMASGQRVVIAKVLGDVRDWPEPKPEGDVEGPEDIWGWTHDEENTSNLRQG